MSTSNQGAAPARGSVFLANLHHAYAQTDGTYAFPNSREGDMLKTAKREIEAAQVQATKVREALRSARACIVMLSEPHEARYLCSDTLKIIDEAINA